jgi:ATP/maltotriose-dependent transcriptional regulator MalT
LLLALQGTVGRYEEAADAAQRLIDVATLSGEQRLVGTGIVNYTFAALHGPTVVSSAIRTSETLLKQVGGDRKAQGLALGVLGVLHAMEGRFDDARRCSDEGRELLEDLGPSILAASTALEGSRIALLAGNPADAEVELRRDYDILEALGEQYYRSTLAGLLANVYWRLSKYEQADRYARVGEEISDADDFWSQALWRSARAKLLARGSQIEPALARANEAVELTATSDDIELRADVLLDLCEVLRLVGRENEQEPHLREALALYSRKGDVVSAGATSQRLGVLAETVP